MLLLLLAVVLHGGHAAMVLENVFVHCDELPFDVYFEEPDLNTLYYSNEPYYGPSARAAKSWREVGYRTVFDARVRNTDASAAVRGMPVKMYFFDAVDRALTARVTTTLELVGTYDDGTDITETVTVPSSDCVALSAATQTIFCWGFKKNAGYVAYEQNFLYVANPLVTFTRVTWAGYTVSLPTTYELYSYTIYKDLPGVCDYLNRQSNITALIATIDDLNTALISPSCNNDFYLKENLTMTENEKILVDALRKRYSTECALESWSNAYGFIKALLTRTFFTKTC